MEIQCITNFTENIAAFLVLRVFCRQ